MRWTFSALVLVWACVAQAQFEKAEAKVRGALAMDKPYKAISWSERALTKKNAPPVFHVLRADGFIRVGKYEQARYQLEQAKSALGETPAYRSQRIGLYLGLGRTDSALMLVSAPEAIVSDAEHLYRVGTVYQRTNDIAKALTYFDLGVRTYPDMARMVRERGSCHALLGDTAKARADLDKAILLAPREAANYNSRGYFRYMLFGEYERAKADMNKAIKQDPNYGYAFSNRGWCEYKLGNVEKARKDLAMATRKNPGNSYAHRSLGIIEVEKGDATKGCGHLRKALELGFTGSYGDEVEVLVAKHCPQVVPVVVPSPVTPPVQAPPSNAPGGTPPKSNAP